LVYVLLQEAHVKNRRAQHFNTLCFLIFGITASACRFITADVACRFDIDCPPDDLPFCTSDDGGVGNCTDDESFKGDADLSFDGSATNSNSSNNDAENNAPPRALP
jgi:hypothetical protein